MKILIVDDDRELVDLLAFALRRAGLDCVGACDAPTALKLFKEQAPVLVVLDINLGATDGFEVLKKIRKRADVPVILLTARQAEDDKVAGFGLGADDYVTKPFGHRELIARIRALLRRQGSGWQAAEPAARRVEVGPLVVDVAEHAAELGGRRLELTVTEFRLLSYLALNAGTVVPTSMLLKQVWGYEDPATDVVRVTVYRLRRKLEAETGQPRLLHTVAGVGILLKDSAQ